MLRTKAYPRTLRPLFRRPSWNHSGDATKTCIRSPSAAFLTGLPDYPRRPKIRWGHLEICHGSVRNSQDISDWRLTSWVCRAVRMSHRPVTFLPRGLCHRVWRKRYREMWVNVWNLMIAFRVKGLLIVQGSVKNWVCEIRRIDEFRVKNLLEWTKIQNNNWKAQMWWICERNCDCKPFRMYKRQSRFKPVRVREWFGMRDLPRIRDLNLSTELNHHMKIRRWRDLGPQWRHKLRICRKQR
jgi:hypothetical protein